MRMNWKGCLCHFLLTSKYSPEDYLSGRLYLHTVMKVAPSSYKHPGMYACICELLTLQTVKQSAFSSKISEKLVWEGKQIVNKKILRRQMRRGECAVLAQQG